MSGVNSDPRSDLRQTLDALVGLRRALHTISDQQTREDLAVAADCLERLVGPTVSRAATARILGVSQTALDRWIGKGEIAAVITPGGRREVPLSQVVDLLEAVDRERGKGPLALAGVIGGRRERAGRLDTERLLPARARNREPIRGHRLAELRSLAYHRAVAAGLDDNEVADARRRLVHWQADGKIHARWASEWQGVLDQPLPEIAKLIGADSQRARALRQSSPFVGLLNEQARRRVLAAVATLAA